MIFKLIVFGLLGLVIYKFIARRLPFLEEDTRGGLEEDTLVECAKCGTFVTDKESIIVQGEVYCSKECAEF